LIVLSVQAFNLYYNLEITFLNQSFSLSITHDCIAIRNLAEHVQIHYIAHITRGVHLIVLARTRSL